MNSQVLVPVLLSVPVIAAVVYLCVRLYRKEAELKAVQTRLPSATATGYYIPGADENDEITVTDQLLYDRCCRYMVERRPYLVGNFSLQDLANAMYTNRLYLSKTINRFSGKNFRAYVNYYRIMYAMELFRANMSLRVIDMAGMSGFKTDSSFLNAFRKVMGEPPSQWCARMKRKYRINKN